MPDKAQLLALAERVEAATGADDDLDIEIAFEIAGQKRPPKDDIYMRVAPPPSYTASLDAALTLVPQGHNWAVEASPRQGPGAWCYDKEIYNTGPSLAATPALALAAAALRARAALSETRP